MLELYIEGMTCAHCERTVTEAIHRVVGDRFVTIDLPTGLTKIEGVSESDTAKITAAITEEGYTVK